MSPTRFPPLDPHPPRSIFSNTRQPLVHYTRIKQHWLQHSFKYKCCSLAFSKQDSFLVDWILDLYSWAWGALPRPSSLILVKHCLLWYVSRIYETHWCQSCSKNRSNWTHTHTQACTNPHAYPQTSSFRMKEFRFIRWCSDRCKWYVKRLVHISSQGCSGRHTAVSLQEPTLIEGKF